MREIKFRAWDKVNKKMFIPNQINGYGTIIVDVWHKEENGFGTHQEEYPNPYILMQYTGLKDKNGKEIYENDIVKTQYGNRSIYCRFGCWFVEGEKELGYYDEMPEVIGDIYENPELLTKQSEVLNMKGGEEVEEIPVMKGTQEALDKIVI